MSSSVPTQDSTLQGESYEQYRAFDRLPDLVKGGTVEPRWEDGDTFVFADHSTEPPVVYRVDPAKDTMVAAPDEEAPEAPVADPARLAALFSPPPYDAPDGRYAIGVDDHDLALTWKADGRTERLTEGGTELMSWAPAQGLSESLDATWAPNSFRLVATKVDSTGVSRSPVVRWLKTREEVEWRVMPRPGERLTRSTFYVVDAVSKVASPIEGTGLEDHLYFPLGWHPDGTEYLLLRADRRMQKLDLLAADTQGRSRVVVSDSSPTFIAGLDLMMRSGRYVHVLGDDQLLWVSERDGWDHLYLYHRDGTLVRRLTEGAFPVLNVLEVDEDAGWVYFTAQSDAARPYDVHLCRVHLDGHGFTQLTDGAGNHHPVSLLFFDETQVRFSPSKRYFLATWSSVTEPPRTELRRADGTLLRVLTTACIDELVETGWTPPEEFVVKAADGGTDLHGVVLRPPHFDAERTYPVLDHIYSGPFVSWVPHSFTAALTKQAQQLAQGGFVVVVVDARGTTGRGKAFQDVVHMSWGRHEIPDHVAAVRQVAASRPFMDLDRVGIFGGSWGGYMTQRAMLQAPEFYKVGVSSAPIADLYDSTVNLEWYVGLPQDNREVYEHASNLDLVDQLQGKLLLMHGTLDLNNAPFSSTMKLVDALIRAGKQFDLAVIPEMGHSPESEKHKRFCADLHFRYFTDHLGVAAPPGADKAEE